MMNIFVRKIEIEDAPSFWSAFAEVAEEKKIPLENRTTPLRED